MRAGTGDGLDAFRDDEQVDEQLDPRRRKLARNLHLGEGHRAHRERLGQRRLCWRQTRRAAGRCTEDVVADATHRLLDELRGRVITNAPPYGTERIDRDARLVRRDPRVVERVGGARRQREQMMHLAMNLLDERFISLRGGDRASFDEHLAVESLGLRDLHERRVEHRRVDVTELVDDRSQEAAGAHAGGRGLHCGDAPTPQRDRRASIVGRGELESPAQSPVPRVDEPMRERRVGERPHGGGGGHRLRMYKEASRAPIAYARSKREVRSSGVRPMCRRVRRFSCRPAPTRREAPRLQADRSRLQASRAAWNWSHERPP